MTLTPDGPHRYSIYALYNYVKRQLHDSIVLHFRQERRAVSIEIRSKPGSALHLRRLPSFSERFRQYFPPFLWNIGMKLVKTESLAADWIPNRRGIFIRLVYKAVPFRYNVDYHMKRGSNL